jgi:CBS domain-containing protein
MTERVVSISPDASVWEAIELMMRNHISSLPCGGGILIT